MHKNCAIITLTQKDGPETLQKFYKLNNFVHVLPKFVYMNLTEKRI